MKKLYRFMAVALLCSLLLSSCAQTPIEPLQAETEALPTETLESEKKTEAPAIMQKSDPAEDGVINVLMIGASSCYYYVEELYGIAKAAGVDMKVCNVYYSGCSLKQHWTWWKTGESNYEYFETDENGRIKYEKYNLVRCLQSENWDVISFQQAVRHTLGDLELAKSTYYPYLSDLLDYTMEQFPQSKFYWHQTWAYQVGYDRNGFAIDSVEKQTEMAGWYRDFALAACEDFPLSRIPCGDAWQIARKDPRAGDVLCDRGDKSDNYHDGDEGGGQYLNACVWFETITGQSCIGNTWRPNGYDLSEEKITALQLAAHQAVAEMKVAV